MLARPTVTVARELLGATLCRRLPDGTMTAAPIVEVEAYTQDDPACHAFRGLTERCRVMFGPPGFAYVYFIYGMYNCLNVVTEPDGVPGAILIRALDIEGCTGPGKLCKTWQIDRSLNGVDLLDSTGPLWLEGGHVTDDEVIATSERIGLNVGQDRIWRFYAKDSDFVSGPRRLGGRKQTRPATEKVAKVLKNL